MNQPRIFVMKNQIIVQVIFKKKYKLLKLLRRSQSMISLMKNKKKIAKELYIEVGSADNNDVTEMPKEVPILSVKQLENGFLKLISLLSPKFIQNLIS